MSTNDLKILSCDIGGTSSRFAVSTFNERGEVTAFRSHWWPTSDYGHFTDLLSEVLKHSEFSGWEELRAVIVAAAGPVENGRICSPPNIAWKIDLRDIERVFPDAQVSLINDFLAQAYSCATATGDTAKIILPGSKSSSGAKGVIGAGTGLGKAFLLPVNGRYVGGASEGGHSHFGIEDETDFALANFIKGKLGVTYVTWEHVVCGAGLARVHEFVSKETLTPAEVAQKLTVESETLKLFAKYYGRACRDVALEFLATGGVFIAGGVAAKNPLITESKHFSEGFYQTQTHAELLKKIPVKLIDNQESGLIGAAYFGLTHLNN